jgi:sugar lactone lactonase YvrE
MRSHTQIGRMLGLLAVCALGLGTRTADAQAVRTVIGPGNEDGLLATQTALSGPAFLAVDATGAIYILEVGWLDRGANAAFGFNGYRLIRRIGPDGRITRIAGQPAPGTSGDGGRATEAQLLGPTQIAIDARGNLYISDIDANRVRKIDPSGMITTFAGAGKRASTGDGGPATAAQLRAPFGVAADLDGNVYISEAEGNKVRRVTPDGNISTYAGTGTRKFDGDGGKAIEASLNTPLALAVDRQGNLYIADTGNRRVRRVDKSGTITTVAGNGSSGAAGDGPATDVPFRNLTGLTVDAAGNLYVAQVQPDQVRRIAPDGTTTIVAGTGQPGFNGDAGKATELQLNTPNDLAIDPTGALLIADGANNRLRRVTADGMMTTIAGGPGASGLPASQVTVILPRGGARDAAGNVYVADIGHHRVLKIDPDGIVTVIAGNGAPGGYRGEGLKATEASVGAPTTGSHMDGLTVDGAGNVYVPDLGQRRVVRIGRDGFLTTVAGNGQAGFSGDGGDARQAKLGNGFWDLALDAQGNLYIADGANRRVRRVGQDGVITTVAGNGTTTYNGDGGKATETGLRQPDGLFVDTAGNLYIAESDPGHRIDKVTSDGIISVVAGTGTRGFTGDGGKATEARLNQPENIAVDKAGNLYIADAGNNRIRRVDPSGIITTFAGTGKTGFNGDDKPLLETNISVPGDLYIDAAGNLIIAEDSFDSMRVRLILRTP